MVGDRWSVGLPGSAIWLQRARPTRHRDKPEGANEKIKLCIRNRGGGNRRVDRITSRLPGGKRAAIRQRAFRDLVQRDGPAALRSRHALPALILVSAVQGDIRGSVEVRSGVQ